jgi:hypothetical protein
MWCRAGGRLDQAQLFAQPAAPSALAQMPDGPSDLFDVHGSDNPSGPIVVIATINSAVENWCVCSA